MLKGKNLIKITIVVVALSLICCLPTLLACNHENTTVVVADAPTCTLNGTENVVCVDCEEVLETRAISPTGHSYGEYVVTREPVLGDDGVELRTCEHCGHEDYRVFECEHETFASSVTEEPTCIELGSEEHVCDTCGFVWYTDILMTDHIESEEAVVVRDATDSSDGVKHTLCVNCDKVLKTENFSMEKTEAEEVKEDVPAPTQRPAPTTAPVTAPEDPTVPPSEGPTVPPSEELTVPPSEEPTVPPTEPKVCTHEKYTSAVIEEPTCLKEGVREYICSDCYISWTEKIAKTTHLETSVVTVTQATCSKAGTERVICSLCSAIIEERPIPVTACSFGDWKTIKAATPMEMGERTRSCTECGNAETESYSLNLPKDNYVYAPGTGLCHSFVITNDLDQATIDTYDIVYFYPPNWKGPCITGHANPSTMQHIYDIKVDSYVYVCVNGTVKKYEVMVSEEGFTDNSCDIYGTATGTYVWSNFGVETLKMFTCYKDGNAGWRWMVMGKLVS